LCSRAGAGAATTAANDAGAGAAAATGENFGAARRRRVWLAGLEVSWKTRALGPRPGSYR